VSQLALLSVPTPPPPNSIDLRCCDVITMLADARGARLIVADPPWQYSEAPGVANPEVNGIYGGLPDSTIAAHLDAAYDSADKACRLAVWYTWPKDAEWAAAGRAGKRWGAVKSGGAWVKQAPTADGHARRVQAGVGYHWWGQSEPVALFVKGACGRPNEWLSNGHVCPPTDHSEKPIEWLRSWVRAWTAPDDLVVCLYSGLAPLARACLMEGRRYMGAEIDPVRHTEALARLAQVPR
jgi:N6-adenosine-specific RNA methylase IME4